MKIRDILLLKYAKHRRAVTIGPDDMVSEVAKKLVEHDRGALSVVDEKGRLVGIITERDLVRKCTAEGLSCSSVRVGDIMTRSVVTGTLEDDTFYAINTMREKRVRHMPILDGEKVVGMISMRDLLGLELSECKTQSQYAHLMPVSARPHRLQVN